MDRARMADISKDAVDMVSSMFAQATRAISMTCGVDREIVVDIVALAFVTVGASVMRRRGKPESEAADQIRGIYAVRLDDDGTKNS